MTFSDRAAGAALAGKVQSRLFLALTLLKTTLSLPGTVFRGIPVVPSPKGVSKGGAMFIHVNNSYLNLREIGSAEPHGDGYTLYRWDGEAITDVPRRYGTMRWQARGPWWRRRRASPFSSSRRG